MGEAGAYICSPQKSLKSVTDGQANTSRLKYWVAEQEAFGAIIHFLGQAAFTLNFDYRSYITRMKLAQYTNFMQASFHVTPLYRSGGLLGQL